MASTGGHGAGCSCGQEVDATGNPLWDVIDFDGIQVAGVRDDSVVRRVIRPWCEKGRELEPAQRLTSLEDDAEMILTIPFVSSVRLKGITMAGPPDDSHPARIKLWANRESLGFDDARDGAGDQAIGINVDPAGNLTYPLNAGKFASVRSVTIFISEAEGGDDVSSVVTFLGFRGISTGFKRDIVDAVYETAPTPGDARNRTADVKSMDAAVAAKEMAMAMQ